VQTAWLGSRQNEQGASASLVPGHGFTAVPQLALLAESPFRRCWRTMYSHASIELGTSSGKSRLYLFALFAARL